MLTFLSHKKTLSWLRGRIVVLWKSISLERVSNFVWIGLFQGPKARKPRRVELVECEMSRLSSFDQVLHDLQILSPFKLESYSFFSASKMNCCVMEDRPGAQHHCLGLSTEHLQKTRLLARRRRGVDWVEFRTDSFAHCLFRARERLAR